MLKLIKYCLRQNNQSIFEQLGYTGIDVGNMIVEGPDAGMMQVCQKIKDGIQDLGNIGVDIRTVSDAQAIDDVAHYRAGIAAIKRDLTYDEINNKNLIQYNIGETLGGENLNLVTKNEMRGIEELFIRYARNPEGQKFAVAGSGFTRAWIFGDVDDNGACTVMDYTYMRQLLLFMRSSFDSEYWLFSADVSGDGVISTADYTYMRRYLLTIIHEFPAEYTCGASGADYYYYYYQGTEGDPVTEDFDTETRNIDPIQKTNNDIVFSNPNFTWKYISEEDFEHYKDLVALSRTESIFEVARKQQAVYGSNGNTDFNLTSEQLAFLYLYDPWGVKLYLTAKDNPDLTKSVFKTLTNRDPKYYSWIDGSWNTSNDWTTTSYSEAEASFIYDHYPLNLVEVVTVGLAAATIAIGIGEIALFVEGVSYFGLRNALTMWSYGTLSSTIAFQRGLNGLTNAANMADDIIELEAGTWQKPWLERGNTIDTARRNNLGHNFPIADRLENRILASTKSLDTAATTYQNGSTLLSKLKSFVNQLNGFTEKEWNGTIIRSTYYDSKSLELVIPDVQLSATQMQAIIDAKTYAQSLGITMKIIVGR